MHPRGFGFVSNPTGADRFVPPAALKDLLDGDTVTYKDRGSEAADLVLVARGRTDVMCDAVSADTLRVDPAIGNLTITPARKLRLGSAYVIRLEPFAVIREFRDPLSQDAIAARVFVRHGIPETLPAPALAERPATSDIARRDLRGMPTITIDDDSSEDLDDALSCQVAPRGDLRVFVHIADVASAVPPRSAIDRAAAQVPTSVYLPQRVRHMLPRGLASDTLSLVPKKDRFALTVEMLISQDGSCRSMDVYPSVINSNQRLSYQTAAQVINGSTSGVKPEIEELVLLLHQAASRISIARQSRGGVNAWRIDSQENHGSSVSEEPAHELIERLMVQTNELIAEFLHSRNLPAVFRTHPELTADQLEELSEKLPDIHVSHPLSPRAFAALALAHRNTRDEPAFWDAALSVMPKASYQLDPAGHFGLGSELYAHFTSPLRRYADLLTHRVLHAWFRGERHVDDSFMRRACVTINDVSRAADLAERDARQLQALSSLEVSGIHDVVVVGSKNRDARVRFLDSGLQALLPRAGHLHAGKKLQVRIVSVDPLTQHLLIEELTSPSFSGNKNGSARSVDPSTKSTKGGPKGSSKTASKDASKAASKPASKGEKRAAKDRNVNDRNVNDRNVHNKKSSSGKSSSNPAARPKPKKDGAKKDGAKKPNTASQTRAGKESPAKTPSRRRQRRSKRSPGKEQ